MQFNFAMLDILAKRPDGQATLDDIQREMQAGPESQNESQARFSEFADVDVFESGLVVLEEGSYRITDAGRSVLRALEDLTGPATHSRRDDEPHSLGWIDDLIGVEQREKIFSLGLRPAGTLLNLDPVGDQQDGEPKATEAEAETSRERDAIVQEAFEEVAVYQHERVAIAHVKSVPPDVPKFLKRSFGAKVREPSLAQRGALLTSISSNLRRFVGLWRGHVAHEMPNVRMESRTAGIGLMFALLSVLVVLMGAGTVIAVNQIGALKSEISALERELAPLKKQAEAKVQRNENKREEDSKREDQGPAASGRRNGSLQSPSGPPALILSPEEIQVVREYIKPAPSERPATAPINVGDSVTSGTIPLPSSLIDKVPKLAGARFTIHDGAIIIIRRDSHEADAVLPPR